jgi:hypothetical protein
MNNLMEVPIASVTALTSERAVAVLRAILRAECGYAALSPSVLTISSRLTVADGGIDAQVDVAPETNIPGDCLFRPGLTGFQIKAGTSFKPWTSSAVRGELLTSKGTLCSEVERLVRRRGQYVVLCTGHDLTPEQRNESRLLIAGCLAEQGFSNYEEQIEVLGASQLAEFAERYPGTASKLATDLIQEAWTLAEWQLDAHMSNAFAPSPEQSALINHIRAGLQGSSKHIRILGEPGLGKTRIVLEAVKDENIAPYVLYVQHGSLFGQTKLFRQLIRTGHQRPLVIVIDELPDAELSDIWRHLKPRCGSLKIVSLDHGQDDSHDSEIDRIQAPRLSDETIKKILVGRIGDSREVDRWIAICEGSPRVAQAVAENLQANPGDILKPPSTIPIWSRYLHGYGHRDEGNSRQIDCVTRHLALFSRFGYEAPVGTEAEYISELVRKMDPTIGWARFQEIVQSLRARRVLQGSRTLFFVPRALHIYLWQQFWTSYGRGFDFSRTFEAMPVSLHAWFMQMFKFAGEAATAHVIDDILRPDGVFSKRDMLTSAKGSRFLSILAEANPLAVLKLLEIALANWSDQEILDFKSERQNLVSTLGKIAVWPQLTARAIHLLARLAVNENANFSNNATGTLLGLFRIGPEAAATEATPEARLPAMLKLLRSTTDAERLLGLRAMGSSLDGGHMGFRFVGPEYQGMKPRAKLWIPETYGDWWQAQHLYFQSLVDETVYWPAPLRADVCQSLLDAVRQQIRTPPCTELALQVLGMLISDRSMSAEKLNGFFSTWREYEDDGSNPEITQRIRRIERSYTQHDFTTRFQRYVMNVSWSEWDDDYREKRGMSGRRARTLVNALAARVTRRPELLADVRHHLAQPSNSPALWHFGEQLALRNPTRSILSSIITLATEENHATLLLGYLSEARKEDPRLYTHTVRSFFAKGVTAWLGATIVLSSTYDDELFSLCLDGLAKGWIDPWQFSALRFGKAIDTIPPERVNRLFRLLSEHESPPAYFLLVELLDGVRLDDTSPVTAEFVFNNVSKVIPGEDGGNSMRGYHWKNVCTKLINWDSSFTLSMLDILLSAMGKTYRLSYDSYVEPLAHELVRAAPVEAWKIVSAHFEASLPEWRDDILQWLKGGLSAFDNHAPRGAIIDLPMPDIMEWIDVDPEPRSVLMAHAAPRTLDDGLGGQLTKALLKKYGQFEGVGNGISATFHSGGWTGPTSVYLKGRRDIFRRWLAAGFDTEVTQWIESEIEYLDQRIVREEIDEERSRFD